MKMNWKVVIVAIIAMLLIGFFAQGQTTVRYPKADGFINDFSHVLSTNEAYQLAAMVSDYEKRTTIEIAVVVMNSIMPVTNIDVYATALFNQWGIGKRGKNNGILFLVALNDRKIRLEVGLGLEKAVPDDAAGRILDDDVIPLLRQNRPGDAIIAGVEAVMKQLDQVNQASRTVGAEAAPQSPSK